MLRLDNMEFGNLTVQRRVPKPKHYIQNGSFWECLCTCGKTRIVRGGDLNAKRVTHCGCLNVKPSKYPIVDGKKKCSRCKEMVPVTGYSSSTDRKDGLQRRCKNCVFEYATVNKDQLRVKGKAARLKKYFNISLEEFEKIFVFQDGKCAICKAPLKKANTDHDHKTGLIRSLLCWICNDAIGRFRENIETLQSAISYLTNPPEKFPASRALGAPRYGLLGPLGANAAQRNLSSR
jgi:hypothetical protein